MNKRMFSAALLSMALMGGCASSMDRSPQGDVDSTLRVDLQKAETALREARLMDAEVLFGQISEKHPELPGVWLRLGNIYARQARNEAAIRAYKQGIKFDRNEGRLWYNLAVVQMKESIKTLEDASVILPRDNPQHPRIRALHETLLDAGGVSIGK